MKKPRRYGKVSNVIDRTFHWLLTLNLFDGVTFENQSQHVVYSFILGLYQISVGLHYGYPLCCCLAQVRREWLDLFKTPEVHNLARMRNDWSWYIPCERCLLTPKRKIYARMSRAGKLPLRQRCVNCGGVWASHFNPHPKMTPKHGVRTHCLEQVELRKQENGRIGLFHHYDENTMFKGENDGSERFTNSLRR